MYISKCVYFIHPFYNLFLYCLRVHQWQLFLLAKKYLSIWYCLCRSATLSQAGIVRNMQMTSNYYQCDYHKKAASSGHLSAGDEGAIVVPASAEVVESVVEVSVPPGLRISFGL